MEQQVAAMLHEVQTLRQTLAHQDQRHAQEIQRLQDKIMPTKPSCWDTMNNFKNFKLFSGDSKEWDEFSTKFRSQVALLFIIRGEHGKFVTDETESTD